MKNNNLSTKDKLLDSAYKEIYMYGFQGCSVDRILTDANVPKGSMYYHYKSKKELALGVIKERISPKMTTFFSFENLSDGDAIEILKEKIIAMSNIEYLLKYGCPLNKLVREMFSLDEDFKKELDYIYKKILLNVEQLLSYALSKNQIIRIDIKSLALFIYTTIIGNLSLGESSATKESFLGSLEHLFNYLNSIKIK